jgi:hypothetical protein
MLILGASGIQVGANLDAARSFFIYVGPEGSVGYVQVPHHASLSQKKKKAEWPETITKI